MSAQLFFKNVKEMLKRLVVNLLTLDVLAMRYDKVYLASSSVGTTAPVTVQVSSRPNVSVSMRGEKISTFRDIFCLPLIARDTVLYVAIYFWSVPESL